MKCDFGGGEVNHVFYVHSHIVYAVAVAVVIEKNFRPDSVLFIYSKRYRPKHLNSYKYKEIPEEFCVFKLFRLERFKIVNLLRKFEKFLVEQGVGDFEAYIPHKLLFSSKFLISQSRCRGYSFIEEGIASYNKSLYKKNDFSLSRGIKYFINPWRRLGVKSFFDDRYVNLYCVSDSAFFCLPGRIVLAPRFDLISDQISVDMSGAVVFVLTPLSSLSKGLAISYIASLVDVLIGKPGANIFYKLHPIQFGSEEEVVIDAIFTGFGAKKLDSDFCVESLKEFSGNISVYHFFSSVALYLIGSSVNVVSQYDSVSRISFPEVEDFARALPPDVFKMLT